MLKIDEVVIVEGKYDKIRLSGIIDGLIIETNGFRIFKDKKKLDLIRKLAVSNGIIILTDSDSAGFLIRNYLKSSITEGRIFHAYIPDILGKEKRKPKISKEGKLGVEGIEAKIIEESIKKSGILIKNSDDISDGESINKNSLQEKTEKEISEREKVAKIKLKFYEMGYCGQNSSNKKRTQLKKALNLPEHLSTNALIKLLSKCFTPSDLDKMLSKF